MLSGVISRVAPSLIVTGGDSLRVRRQEMTLAHVCPWNAFLLLVAHSRRLNASSVEALDQARAMTEADCASSLPLVTEPQLFYILCQNRWERHGLWIQKGVGDEHSSAGG